MFTRQPLKAGRDAITGSRHAAENATALRSIEPVSVLGSAERAYCCSARPTVVAVFPPRTGRSHSVDLLLCGHHYRACRSELNKAGAEIYRMPAD
jgi:hypothetical protein